MRPREGDEVSLLDALGVVLRHRRSIGGAIVAGGLLGLALAAVRPTRWTSTASFVPQAAPSSAIPSQLAAMGGAMGIRLNSEPAESPEFYLELLRSRPVLSRLAQDSVSVSGDSPFVGPLADWVAADEQGAGRRHDVTLRWLEDQAMWTGIRRGIVQLRVSTASPELSRSLAAHALDHLAEFNVGKRQARAQSERAFVEGRLAVARRELADAEGALQRFVQANRQFNPASDLALRQDALERDIAIRQQLLTSLAQQYEQARIDEVRSTSVISVIDEPNLPSTPDPRRLLFATVAGMLGAGMLALLVAFLLDRSRPTDSAGALPRFSVVAGESFPPRQIQRS